MTREGAAIPREDHGGRGDGWNLRECRDSNRGREGKKGEPDRSEVGRESPRGMEPRSGPGLGSLVGLSVDFTLDSVWKWWDLRSFAKEAFRPMYYFPD